jgi:acetylornithine/succinyldiaminopimelate/putrescine aminotransferase
MNTQEYLDLENEYGAHNYKPLDVVLNKGRGVWVWDVDGKKYLDCLAAYSAVNQGHCHPEILKTMMAQAQNLTLTSRAFRNDQLGQFYKDICEADAFPQGAAHEQRRRSGGNRDQGSQKMGLPGQGHPRGRGGDHCLRQ